MAANDKPKRRIMSKFRLDEISIVDNPAQAPARIAILKRAEPLQKNRRALTTMTAGHAHSLILMDGRADIKAGTTSYVEGENDRGHAHDWVMDDAGNIIIAEAMGHTHGVNVLVKADGTREIETTTEEVPASSADQVQAGITQPAESVGKSEDNEMSDQDKSAEQKAELEKAQKRAERAEAIIKLTPEQRTHFDTLKGDEADAFLAKSSEEKDAVLKNLRDADPVVYKSADGVEFRKSDDARLVQMAKDRDNDRAELARERAVAKKADLEKRAGDVFKGLTGDIVAKAALLGAVESIEDEGVRTQVTEMLKAKDAGMQKAFQRQGTSESPDTDGALTPDQEIDALAKQHAKDKGVTIEKAYADVLSTPEGIALYNKRFTVNG